MLLAGCSQGIEIRPLGEQARPPAATLIHREHAVAVLGVDYDPPLEGTVWTAGTLDEGVTLLAAVANQGRVPERDVQVAVSLLDPGARPGSQELATETQVIKVLPPGEVAQVRFAAASDVPPRPRYLLKVEALPVPGEVDVADNVWHCDIRLQAGP